VKPIFALPAILFVAFTNSAGAVDVMSSKMMTLDLARDIANHVLQECRKKGYNTAVVVVDRASDPQVVLRDVYVSRYAIELATRKANAVILSGVDTENLIKNRSDIRAELNELPGILLLPGGLPIRAGGSLIGAVGVSGAPGGERDVACAAAGIKLIQDRLDFAE